MLSSNCINKEVQFAGILSEIPMALDPSCRSEVLKMVDQGRREKRLVQGSRLKLGAVLHVDANNIKLFSTDNNQDSLLRIPIHQVAAVSYIKDEDQHILSIKFGEVTKMRSTDETLTCSLAILYCDSRTTAEEICSCVDLCFQTIFTDATMNFFDRSLLEGSQTLKRDGPHSFFFNQKTRNTVLTDLSTQHESLGFLSTSNLSLGNSALTSSGTALSHLTRQSSESMISSAANELILDYMNKLYTKLSSSELQEFAMLIKAWHTNMTFPDFCEKVLVLYGPERRNLLVGMRPFIPAKDSVYFEHFLQCNGCVEDACSINTQISDESWTIIGRQQHPCGSSGSVADGFEMVDRSAPTDETGSNASLDMS